MRGALGVDRALQSNATPGNTGKSGAAMHGMLGISKYSYVHLHS